MTDNNTLNGALMKLGETITENLEAMGVTDASPNNGLTTLARRILDIEPSIKGLNLDISLATTTTQKIIGLGESIILTSTLRASYDDTTVTDVDLSGGLTGATVKFYNGTTLLGTGITDLNGVATYTYTPSQLGNFTFHTVFEGTENFTNCTSNNVNITVINPPTSLVFQIDKSILSYYDDDTCVLTATLYDNNNIPMEGLGVVFKTGDIILAIVATNSSGVAEYTYNSQGVGDVTITAECMNLTETYTLEDCNYYSETGITLIQNDSTDTSYPSNIPYHHEGTEKYMVEFDFTMKSKFRFYYLSTEVTSKGDKQEYGYGFSRDNSGNFTISTRTTITSSSRYTTGLANGEERRIKMIIDGTTVSFYDNGNLIGTQTNEWLTTNPPAYFSWATWTTGTVTVKNIKIKQLLQNHQPSTPVVSKILLTTDKQVLSHYDNESCTLTATLLDSNGNGVSGEEIVFKANGGLLGTVITGDNGVAQCTYQSTGVGDVTITAECMNLVQTFVVEDCTYYDTVTYKSETTKNISVPSNFKLEFDLYPKSRSTSSGGVSHYVKLTRPSTTDMWFGQGTSSGNHGIMVRPSTNYWCSSLTTLNTDNHVVVTYDGNNVLYTCNGESKSVSYSNGFGVISGISSTSNGNLKNLKIKPLP